MSNFITQLVKLALIYVGRNVRLPSLMKIQELAADIAENGLLTPIVVYRVKDKFEVIQGHRRESALRSLLANDPERFNVLFPNGIPVTIVEGVTYEEAQEMKIDHGNELSLTDPMELQLCANMLFAQGKGEKPVVIRLASLMDRMKPMKADKLKKYQGMLADAQLWLEKGNKANAKEKQAEAEKFLLDYRRGYVQNLHNAYRCPHIVMAALYLKATGERPTKDEEFAVDEKVFLPVGLTYQHVNSLWKAFEKDLTILKDGKQVHNRRVPGPEFNAKWKVICDELAKKAEASEDGTPRAKAMSAGDMETELKEGKWHSAFGQLLTRHHRKETGVDMTQLVTLDKVAYFAELLSERAPEEWAASVKLAEAIEKEQIAANEQAAPPPKKAKGGKK
jgi:ParB/Sulfiredoxin domain